MKLFNLSFYRVAKPGFDAIVACMLLVYAICYQPFITESYLSPALRIGVEGAVLTLLFLINMRYSYFVGLVWTLPCILIFAIALAFGLNTIQNSISFLNKIIFIILAIGLFHGNRSILEVCNKILIFTAYFLSVTAILAFTAYSTGIITFNELDLGGEIGSGEWTSYYYLHNSILGNLSPRTLFGFNFGRVCGYVYEGGMLGIIFALNILLARNWINDVKKRTTFVRLNFIAGITTLSSTFFSFSAIYFLYKVLSKYKVNKKIQFFTFVLFGILLALLMTISQYYDQTSASTRIYRMAMYFSLYENITLLNFLLGNGVGLAAETLGRGIDSGWLNIIIERGFFMVMLYIYMYIFLTKHNPALMAYLFIVNFVFNTFAAPFYMLIIAVSYVNYKHNFSGFSRLP
jgi:hypothetical protein